MRASFRGGCFSRCRRRKPCISSRRTADFAARPLAIVSPSTKGKKEIGCPWLHVAFIAARWASFWAIVALYCCASSRCIDRLVWSVALMPSLFTRSSSISFWTSSREFFRARAFCSFFSTMSCLLSSNSSRADIGKAPCRPPFEGLGSNLVSISEIATSCGVKGGSKLTSADGVFRGVISLIMFSPVSLSGPRADRSMAPAKQTGWD
mmetsp:Transcript_22350/g.51824  ORF Transcript_22350/g.51824 Transcript_22350/m.51824 type:complete len:207 (-) Transcript_22350:88-708(-)